jgi:hypothetical protein
MANPRKRKLRKRMRSGGGAVETTETAKVTETVEAPEPVVTKEEPKGPSSLDKLEKKVDKTETTKDSTAETKDK